MNNITFIIGAGASHDGDYYFPMGEVLVKNMRAAFQSIQLTRTEFIEWDFSLSTSTENYQRLVEQYNFMLDCIKQHITAAYHQENENLCTLGGIDMEDAWGIYRTAAINMSERLLGATSIDNFLHQQNDDAMSVWAKIAITYAILAAEKNSWLSKLEMREFKKEKLSDTWYQKFFNLVIGEKPLGELDERFNQITLIIFNYDRCVEHFLHCQLMNQYGISSEAAADLIKKIAIFHPYGKVGNLPWEEKSRYSIKFGDSLIVQGGGLYDISKKIKTFNESTDLSGDFVEIEKRMNLSHKVVYLGYGFHAQNSRFIPKAPRGRGFCQYYATAKGIIEDVYSDIQDIIEARARHDRGLYRIVIKDLTCNELLEKFRISLQF